MQSWYVLEQSPEGNVTKGPFGLPEMSAMVAAGRLVRASFVARAGSPQWIAAGDDPELASLFLTAAPPVQPAFALHPAPLPPYSIGAAFELGWKTFTNNWGKLVLVVLCLLGISIILGIPVQAGFAALAGLGQKARHREAVVLAGGGLGCCSMVLAFLVGIPLGTGFMYAGVRAVRGELAVSDIFAGFNRYGAVLGTGVLSKLIAIGIALVCLIPLGIGLAISADDGNPISAVIGGFFSVPALLAVLCFVSVFLTIPTLLVIDPRVRARGGIPALSIAWQMGKGNSPSFFLLMICAAIIAEVSFCALCVGYVLFGLPLFLALLGAAYELMVAPVVASGPDPRKLP